MSVCTVKGPIFVWLVSGVGGVGLGGVSSQWHVKRKAQSSIWRARRRWLRRRHSKLD